VLVDGGTTWCDRVRLKVGGWNESQAVHDGADSAEDVSLSGLECHRGILNVCNGYTDIRSATSWSETHQADWVKRKGLDRSSVQLLVIDHVEF
jgi:hypothetical protein